MSLKYTVYIRIHITHVDVNITYAWFLLYLHIICPDLNLDIDQLISGKNKTPIYCPCLYTVVLIGWSFSSILIAWLVREETQLLSLQQRIANCRVCFPNITLQLYIFNNL